MRKIEYGDTSAPAEFKDTVSLQKLENLDVVRCQETGVLMLNIDADQIEPGDLSFIKKLGLTISNPDTEKPVAIGVDYKEDSWGHRLARFFESSDEDDDDDDDSSFFGGGGFLGGSGNSGFGNFGGSSSGSGFGGFGGGSFSGGGASRGF